MKVLVVGSGGREHTLVWKLSQSPQVKSIYAAPGNAGMTAHAECVPVSASDCDGLLDLALEKEIDLTVVGPEAPLVAGIVDLFHSRGVRIFGFDRWGARLEGSKVWAKEFMKRHGIPTGSFTVCEDVDTALREIRSGAPPFVIKADGLAAGKGVLICNTQEEARSAIDTVMREKAFGSAGDRIVLEEFLNGPEISILAVYDGESYRLFIPSQDHKRAFDGDEGPNTGGMGAYAPVPFIEERLEERVRREIVEPTFSGMKQEGISGAGVLYFGLIITGEGPKVLEYNCRFGDPETQVILPLLADDLFEVLHAATEGRLGKVPFRNSDHAAACVVVASGGYPGSYRKGYPITGLDEARGEGCIVFHAGTSFDDGEYRTAGGRVLGVTAVAPTLTGALEKAYRGVAAIHFTDCFSRSDIGRKGVRSV